MTEIPNTLRAPPAERSNADRLEEILQQLKRMDRRDKLRTWGGFFKGVLSLIPIAILLLSTWYLYKYGDVFIEKISSIAAKQAAGYSQSQSADAVKQLQDLLER